MGRPHPACGTIVSTSPNYTAHAVPFLHYDATQRIERAKHLFLPIFFLRLHPALVAVRFRRLLWVGCLHRREAALPEALAREVGEAYRQALLARNGHDGPELVRPCPARRLQWTRCLWRRCERCIERAFRRGEVLLEETVMVCPGALNQRKCGRTFNAARVHVVFHNFLRRLPRHPSSATISFSSSSSSRTTFARRRKRYKTTVRL